MGCASAALSWWVAGRREIQTWRNFFLLHPVRGQGQAGHIENLYHVVLSAYVFFILIPFFVVMEHTDPLLFDEMLVLCVINRVVHLVGD